MYIIDKDSFMKTLQIYDFVNLTDLDKLIYIRLLNDQIGYGVFAKKFIKKNSVIGEYTGVIGRLPTDNSYCFAYYSILDKDDSILVVNAK